MLGPTEQVQAVQRRLEGLPPLHHLRLKHKGRTLVVVSGASEQEARQRVDRLIDALLLDKGSVVIEQA